MCFLPAYNEEESIGTVIESIPRDFHDKVDVKVLVIDDGSSDRTVQVSKRSWSRLCCQFSKKQGLGAAVRAGLRECFERGADIGVMIDADGEYPAEYIPNLLKPIFPRGGRLYNGVPLFRNHKGNEAASAFRQLLFYVPSELVIEEMDLRRTVGDEGFY